MSIILSVKRKGIIMPTITEKFKRINKAQKELKEALNDLTSEELRLYNAILKKYKANYSKEEQYLLVK